MTVQVNCIFSKSWNSLIIMNMVLQALLVSTTGPKSLVSSLPSSLDATWVPAPAHVSSPNCIVHRLSPPVHYRFNNTAHLVHKMVSPAINPTSPPRYVYKTEIYSQTQNWTTPETSSNNVHNMGKVPTQKPRKPNRICRSMNKQELHRKY